MAAASLSSAASPHSPSVGLRPAPAVAACLPLAAGPPVTKGNLHSFSTCWGRGSLATSLLASVFAIELETREGKKETCPNIKIVTVVTDYVESSFVSWVTVICLN